MSKSTTIRGKLILKENSLTESLTNRILSIDPTTGEITDRPAISATGYVSSTLPSAQIIVGNGSSIATAVAMTGDVTISNAGVTAISSGVIVNADVNASAAIAYSKLNLAGSILNADINASAGITYSKLSLTGSILNADIAAAAGIARTKLASGTSYRLIANNASGVMSENAALTASRVPTVDANGQLTTAVSTTTATQLNYLNTATSNIQTQLNTLIATQAIDALVAAPTVTEDGYAITWDEGTNKYILADPVAQGLPTGGSARQYLIKQSGTNYDAAFDDPVLDDITDVTATVDDVNLLQGQQAAGLTGTEIGHLIGTTSNIQNQLTQKQDRALSYNSIWVGNVSGVPAALSAGTNGYVLTITSGTPSWQPAVAGFANPMTTEGDLIIGDTGGSPIRIGIGTSGQVLTSDGTTASWEDPAAGAGTVTSVALSLPSFITVSGSPVTTTGTLTGTLATQTANTVFAGPTGGGAATPTFRAMVSADIPNQGVTYAKIQNVAANSFLANVTGSSASATDVATNRIPLFGSAITGTPDASTFLRGDGSWATPFSLTDGSGTTANGTAVDLGGTLTNNVAINGAYSFRIGNTTKATLITVNATDYVEIQGSSTSGFNVNRFGWKDASLVKYMDVAATKDSVALSYNFVSVWHGFRATTTYGEWFHASGAARLGDNGGIKYQADYSANYTTRSLVDRAYADLKLLNPLTTTGDIIQSSSGSTPARLAAVSAGSFLRSGGVSTVNAWSTVKLPDTISAGSIWVANAANTMIEVTPSAGQSIRWNAGGTAWEAYTPGSGGISNTAANNEIPKSDGTDIGPSGIFSTTAGSISLGSASISGGRTIEVLSSDTNANLTLEPKAAGGLITDAGYIQFVSSTGQVYSDGGTNIFRIGSATAYGSGIYFYTSGNTEYFLNTSGFSKKTLGSPFTIFGTDGSALSNPGMGISLIGGDAYASSNQDGGDIVFQAGLKDGSGSDGQVQIQHSGSELIPLDRNGHVTESADFALGEEHRGKIVYCTKAGTQTITVPSGFIEGWNTILVAFGASTTISLSASGTTLVGKTSTTTQYETIALDHTPTSETYLGI